MKAQRTQDAIDGAQSDLRQDKLIIVAGQQASSTAALARSSADQLVSIKASADAAIAQAHAASAASGATGRLAQSSSDQVKVLLDADRAWISAATVPNSFDFVVGQDFVAHTQISNTGKSPAIKVRSFTKWEIMERTSPYEALKECETCASEAVFPGTMRTIEPKILGSALTQSEVEGLKSGVKIFVVRVRVDYSDVSGRRHTTTMCSFYNLPTKGFTACAVGSEAT
ncbi:hypothetical protein ASD79_18235 [Caulobacter sp. Root655]|nr:hypothetical protein ASD79_18235 [Caulobacter sp. Root655]